jgi:hypothetical protein
MQVYFETKMEEDQRTTIAPSNYFLKIEAKGTRQEIECYKNLIFNIDKFFKKEII